MASSFAGVSFRVVPDDGFFPGPVEGSDGVVHYEADVLFASKSARNSLADKVTIVTWKRILGSKSYNGHIDAGYGSGTLVVPLHGGTTGSYTAVLVAMTDTKGYGRLATGEYTASVDFVIVSDATV
jgi:hypothetical protein